MRPILVVLLVLALAAGATAFALLSGGESTAIDPPSGTGTPAERDAADRSGPGDPVDAEPAPGPEPTPEPRSDGPPPVADAPGTPVRVVSRATMKPIAGATISHGDRTVRADADGRASAPIDATVRVDAPGFATGVVRIDARDGGGRIALPPLATLAGIVRDTTSAAVSGASVRVTVTADPLPDPEGFPVTVPPIGVVTGDDGRFAADVPSAVPLAVDALGGFGGPARYGDVVVLGPGARREIQLPFRPAGRLHGTVVDAAGAPVPGVTILVSGTADVALSVDAYGRDTRSAADGAFAIDGMPLGSWRVVAAPPTGSGLAAAVATVRIARHGESAGTRITLEAGRTIRGRVLDPREAPVGGATVVGSWPGGVTARSGNDGSFAVGPVPSGAHRVRAIGVATFGHSRWVDVGPDDASVDLRLTVAGRVTIVVLDRDGKPTPAIVELRSVDWGRDAAATTASAGAFKGAAGFEPVAEGRYVAIVRDQKRYALDGPFAVTAGAETTRTIPLRDGAHATIVIKQPAGGPPIEQPVAKIVCDGVELARDPVGALKTFQVPANRRVAIRVEYRQAGIDKHIEHRLSLVDGTNEFVEVP